MDEAKTDTGDVGHGEGGSAAGEDASERNEASGSPSKRKSRFGGFGRLTRSGKSADGEAEGNGKDQSGGADGGGDQGAGDAPQSSPQPPKAKQLPPLGLFLSRSAGRREPRQPHQQRPISAAAAGAAAQLTGHEL